jgi:hypothetical protein
MPMFRPVSMAASIAAAAFAGVVASASANMATPGQFSVSENGAASYAIPLAVPPGTAGMAPQLGLSYNSQAPAGLVGVGWSLTGLSSITRCPQTVAQDGKITGVNYDANDRFCLDGQRLIPTNGGVYGANLTEYHTEHDSFAKVVSNGTAGNGPSWFRVMDKAGRVVEYGNTADSKILAQGSATARIWAINKITDVKGNYLSITYDSEPGAGNYFPKQIDYTGNSALGQAPYNSVRFEYETRNDVTTAYQAGALVKNSVRLKTIRSFAGAGEIKEYRLAYLEEATSQRSRLYTVTECDGDSICLGPTKATYSSYSAPSFAPTVQSGVTDWGYESTRAWVDFNGDGKADFCRGIGDPSAMTLACTPSTGTGFTTTVLSPYTISPFYDGYSGWADVNGDGLPDFCTAVGDPGAEVVKCNPSTGTGFGPPIQSAPGVDKGYADGS